MTKYIVFVGVLVGVVVLILTTGSLSSPQDSPATDTTSSAPTNSYTNLDPANFKALVNEDGVFVVDVHIPEQEHIDGTDAFIPYNEIANRLNELPQDKNAKILVYCRSGGMSAIASDVLVKNGYTNVFNLSGGKNAYDRYEEQSSKPEKAVSDFEITPKTQDLGVVVFGDVAMTQFLIKNNTDKTIKLARVTTSCGCTKAFPAKDVIVPGEEVPMKVTFDPAVHGDDTDLGELTRTVYVKTDQADIPVFENTITANVVKN